MFNRQSQLVKRMRSAKESCVEKVKSVNMNYKQKIGVQ